MSATISLVSQEYLTFRDGRSDKIYLVQVQQIEDAGAVSYATVVYYGRRGSSLANKVYYEGTNLASANAAASKQVSTKLRHPSTPYSVEVLAPGVRLPGLPSDAPVAGASTTGSWAAPMPKVAGKAGPKVVGPAPMKATPIEDLRGPSIPDAYEDRLEAMFSGPYAGQQKYDGERCLISVRRGSPLVASNLKGVQRPVSKDVKTFLHKLTAKPDFNDERETIFDGEIMGDIYMVYDVLVLRDVDMKKISFAERFSALEELLCDEFGVLLAETAWTSDEKRAMRKRAADSEWEGMMFRHVDKPYVAGVSADVIKDKLWASATCRVLTVNAKRSIQVALRGPDGTEEFVGNVTVPVNQDIPEPDDLVEVRYLYAAEGGSLYQPTLLGVRTDKDEADLRSSLRRPPPEKTVAAV